MVLNRETLLEMLRNKTTQVGVIVVLSFLFVGSVFALTPLKELIASDASDYDWLGFSLALDGEYLVAGAQGAGNNGAAYVFEKNSGIANNWGQKDKLSPFGMFSSSKHARFGVSTDVDGSYIVVGADGDDLGAEDSGTAYVFKRGILGWNQVAMLAPNDWQAQKNFGRSVAISGDTVAVGASGELNGKGSVYIFKRDQGGSDRWGFFQKIENLGGKEKDYFGYTVALDGNTLVIGAYSADTGSLETNEGAVFVFKRNDGNAQFTQTKKIMGESSKDNFGLSLSISGTNFVVGAPYADTNKTDAGKVYLFSDTDNYTTPTLFVANDPADFDNFGKSVSIFGNQVLIGAWSHDTNGVADSGKVYLFSKTDEVFTLTDTLNATTPTASSYFGKVVALTNGFAAISSPWSNTGFFGNETGEGFVFEIANTTCVFGTSTFGACTF